MLLGASAVVAGVVMPAGGAGAALPPCAGDDALALSFARAVGARTGTLSWSTGAASRVGTYRVFRDKDVVGETAGRSIAVEVRAGRTYTFTVRFVEATGKLSDCGARIRRTVRFHGPDRPAGLGVTGARKGRARLVWSPSKPGDGRVSGYRVYRDGRAYRRVRGRALQVRAGHAHVYRVAATDTRGHVSAQSNAGAGRPRPPGSAPAGAAAGHARPGLGGPPVVVGRRGARAASPATASTAAG